MNSLTVPVIMKELKIISPNMSKDDIDYLANRIVQYEREISEIVLR
jgi:hypothetical protein